MAVNLLHVWIDDIFSIHVQVGIALFGVIILVIIVVAVIRLFSSRRDLTFRETELNISLGGIGSIKIKSTYEVAQIAHKAWSELITRKAGLPFDPENDVIVEVYNSWHQLFSEIRTLVKEVPACHIRKNGTQALVNLLVDSLNKGMRPHLTRWQAKYRRWYDAELKNEINNGRSPQEIQKMYPQYNELVQDLILINQQLVSYTFEIKKLIT